MKTMFWVYGVFTIYCLVFSVVSKLRERLCAGCYKYLSLSGVFTIYKQLYDSSLRSSLSVPTAQTERAEDAKLER